MRTLVMADRHLRMDGENVETMIDRMRYHKPAAPLRKVAIYSNDNFTLAGKIVSVLSGMPYHEFVKKNILDPLGMSDSQYDRLGAQASGRRVEGFQHYGIDKKVAANLIEQGKWGEACSGKLGQTEFWSDDGMHFAGAGGLWTTGDDIVRLCKVPINQTQADRAVSVAKRDLGTLDPVCRAAAGAQSASHTVDRRGPTSHDQP